ncbi:hypothetical protein QQF73_04485 [Marinobacter sp. M216]|uniref:L-2-amino-thiazoline-4-carboxylic acid hydrolase n=1 Tax=Marinobacter albus TaxID=3030833 RepID=A0ABT7HA08_9GAMM|nr:hypothetical protein [Marinobacter sp. M216]MDK9556872.1 hypothetical protein [Marinobacter sp. M216]
MSLQNKKMSLLNRTFIGGCKRIFKPIFRRSARQVLKGRLLDLEEPERGRWLESDVKEYLKQTWTRSDLLMPIAELDHLPTFGNRLTVFLSVITTAAYQEMMARGVPSEYAKTLVGDLGWKVYNWMLTAVSMPFRVTSRNPARRMERVLRALMVFPFSAPGAPGYEVKVWTEGSNTHTHWTHCPPQTFVRRVIELNGDQGELDAFFKSWCLYDWPGADVIANDGQHGHYTRLHTLSRGGSVCDMCWHGCAKSGKE